MMIYYLSNLLALIVFVLPVMPQVTESLFKEESIATVPHAPPQRGLRAYFSGVDDDDNKGSTEFSSSFEFDFLVAGFPKCGTTTLLKTFATHPETSMAANEQCAVAAPSQADLIVLQKLTEIRETLVGEQTAFKCPNALYTYKSIIRLEKHSPQARLVIGIRHPVLMMESYFNYRITEMYHNGAKESAPDFASLVQLGSNWKGVSLGCTRFDLFLMQLGKTDITPDNFDEMLSFSKDFGYDMAVKPCKMKVFLYTVEQLDDTDEDRSFIFRATMQMFLKLHERIPPFGHENINHATGQAGFAESISICDPQYASIRRRLIENANRASTWIINHFIKSPDVVVANPEHFVALLEDWSHDPCTASEVLEPL